MDRIETYINDGRNSVLVMGDLNGKTKTEDDFVRDSDDEHSLINDIQIYITDSQLKKKTETPTRLMNKEK